MVFSFAFALQTMNPVFATERVNIDPDDPAIWRNSANPAKSLILGTDKGSGNTGALYVFDLNGKIVQRIGNLARPNNVDVEYGVPAGKEKWDIAAVTEREKNRILFFRILKNGRLVDVTGRTRVFTDEGGEYAAPMGIGIYKNPKTSQCEVVVTPKEGAKTDHLSRSRLKFAEGKIDLVDEQRFGGYSGTKETESVVVDDRRGLVFYSDELDSIRVYDLVGKSDFKRFSMGIHKGDREGLALFGSWLVSCDQIKASEGGSRLHIFSTSSSNGPKWELYDTIQTPSDETDGLDLSPLSFGPKFPFGLLVMMNSGGKNFLVFNLRTVNADWS